MKKKYTKKQKKNLEKFKNAQFNYMKFVRKYYMEKGEAYITIKVNSYYDIISKYSIKGYEWINSEFSDYIEECANYIPTETGIVIEICGVQFTEEQQETIENVIKNYFGLVLQDKEADIKINKGKSNRLLISGIISVIFFVLIQNKNIGALLTELLILVIWFFIWEYGDYAIIENHDLKREKLYAGQLASAKIRFIENEEESETKKENIETEKEEVDELKVD